MSTSSDSQYMLLFRGQDWDRGVSRDETQRRMDRVMAWFAKLQERGVVRGGHPLAREGAIVSRNGERTVSDGPFAESKEVVGGYLVVQVEDLDEAVSIAESCPTLDFGIEVEVRPMLEECPISKRLREDRVPAMA